MAPSDEALFCSVFARIVSFTADLSQGRKDFFFPGEGGCTKKWIFAPLRGSIDLSRLEMSESG